MSRFVMITPNTDFDARVRQARPAVCPAACRPSPSSIRRDPGALFTNLNQERPEVLILGPDPPFEDALRLAMVFDVQLPELASFWSANLIPAFVLLAMRAGIRDFLSPNAEMPQIRISAGARLPVLCQQVQDRGRSEGRGPEWPGDRRLLAQGRSRQDGQSPRTSP